MCSKWRFERISSENIRTSTTSFGWPLLSPTSTEPMTSGFAWPRLTSPKKTPAPLLADTELGEGDRSQAAWWRWLGTWLSAMRTIFFTGQPMSSSSNQCWYTMCIYIYRSLFSLPFLPYIVGFDRIAHQMMGRRHIISQAAQDNDALSFFVCCGSRRYWND